MHFACSKRGLRLKSIDSCLQDVKESRLVEETFTVEEVSTAAVVYSKVEFELINTAHTSVLLLQQLFSQAEKATHALDEKSKLERELQDLQLDQGNNKDFIKSEFQKTLNDKTENQKSLEENLAMAKHDLLRVQEQLGMAEKELEEKFQQQLIET
ncbi:unnamed protein product [Nyctereutes procyonoides]|uniref:Leucine zipper transcription factor-like protein 1 n=1 Tax=Nyctereutes procyonoides TaxID=34880 RepID=A0A811YCQ8_NYCPR|nr:unnamed protein product [Nyctereutes procyonoides]